MKILIMLTLFISGLTISLPVMPQEVPSTPQEISSTLQKPEVSDNVIVTPLSTLEFILSVSVLAFGLIVILFEIVLIKNKKINTGDTIKFITVTLIITSTLYLITAGYSNDQIAPAVGLLGTIAGYLLGRIQPSDKKEEKHEAAV